MTLDIRLPIGLLFSVLGLLLGAEGLLAAPPAGGWDGLNVDLVWGGVLALFGASMLALWRRGRRRHPGPA